MAPSTLTRVQGVMDIVFFGAGAFGVPTLAALAADPAFRLRAVVTQPDRPAGRGVRLTGTPVAQWCGEHAPPVEVIRAQDVNEPGTRDRVRAIPADAWVVIAFGQKLSPALLEGRFAVNLHASLLPRWRGAAPIQRAVMAGDRETGVSVITLADRMDAGVVLARSVRPIAAHQTAGDLHDLLAQDGPALVRGVLVRPPGERPRGAAQDPALVTKAPKLSREEGWVDLAATAAAARARINGLSPWPGVAATIGGEPIKLLRATEDASPSRAPSGTIIDSRAGLVSCGGGTVLRVLEVQQPGKRAMDWPAFAAGHAPRAGDVIEGGVAGASWAMEGRG